MKCYLTSSLINCVSLLPRMQEISFQNARNQQKKTQKLRGTCPRTPITGSGPSTTSPIEKMGSSSIIILLLMKLSIIFIFKSEVTIIDSMADKHNVGGTHVRYVNSPHPPCNFLRGNVIVRHFPDEMLLNAIVDKLCQLIAQNAGNRVSECEK